MPRVRFYKPCQSERWLIRQYESIRSGNSTHEYGDFFIPRPDVALVFHFKAIPWLTHPFEMPFQPVFVASVATKPLHLEVDGELDSFIAVCKATVLSSVLKLNLAGDKMAIGLPDGRLESLCQGLKETDSDLERIGIFSRHFKALCPEDYKPDIIDRIYDEIIENSLEISLKRLYAMAGCSPSTLQRHFLVRAGVSMKKLVRIARIHSIFEKMLEKDCFSGREFLFSSNFYDQAHFIRDFKNLTGETPKKFFNRHTELCRILSGMHKEFHSLQ